MMTSAFARRLLAASVIALGVGQAQAATFDLNLSGSVSAGSYGSFDWNGNHYDNWSLSLSGLDSSNAITVAVGDTINATITLDQSFTIPVSALVNRNWITFALGGSGFPSVDTSTIKDAVAFFDSGVAGVSQSDSNCSTNGYFASCNVFWPPAIPSITFDTVVASFEIEKIGAIPGQAVTLDNSQFSYSLQTPAVPEPETYAMMMAGLGLMGVVARRRKSKQQ
jgi:hypothetical protein